MIISIFRATARDPKLSHAEALRGMLAIIDAVGWRSISLFWLLENRKDRSETLGFAALHESGHGRQPETPEKAKLLPVIGALRTPANLPADCNRPPECARGPSITY